MEAGINMNKVFSKKMRAMQDMTDIQLKMSHVGFFYVPGYFDIIPDLLKIVSAIKNISTGQILHRPQCLVAVKPLENAVIPTTSFLD